MQGRHGGRVHRAGEDAGHCGAQRTSFAEGGQGRRQGCFRGYPRVGMNEVVNELTR